MKTAEEIIKKYELQSLGNGVKAPINALIKGAMKEYARQACKEQRRICAEDGMDVWNGAYTFQDIDNAPEPELK